MALLEGLVSEIGGSIVRTDDVSFDLADADMLGANIEVQASLLYAQLNTGRSWNELSDDEKVPYLVGAMSKGKVITVQVLK